MSQNAPNSASPVTTAGRISPGRCRSSRSSACSCALRRDSCARPSGKKSQHMKAHRPPDAGKNGKVPRLPAGNAARALRALDHTLAAAERHMQRVTLITQHGLRLQGPLRCCMASSSSSLV